MAIQITSALYAEGDKDYYFLTTLISRTIDASLRSYGRYDTYIVIDPFPVDHKTDYKDIEKEAERVLQAAIDFQVDILFFHADADSSTPTNALKRRYMPAKKLLEEERLNKSNLVNQIVPIIPIRNIEAWLLADEKTLQKVLQFSIQLGVLKTISKPKQVETIQSKEEFNNLVAEVSRLQNRRLRENDFYKPLGEQIDLTILESVPSYKRFKDDLEAALKDAGILPPNS
jgi:Domain of unknown function (DUF4276)